MLQFLICSDLHTYVDNLRPALEMAGRTDAVLIAGDLEAEQDELEEVLGPVPFYAVCGNNDYYLRTEYPEELLLDLTDDPPSGPAPALVNVTRLQYNSLPESPAMGSFKNRSGKGLIGQLAAENRIPAFLAGILAGKKRGEEVSHRILITHGKEYDVPGTRLLIRRASLWGADLVLYGHTHQFADSTGAGGRIRLINPGCLVGDPHMSYGISSRYEICSFAVLRIGTDGEISVRHLHL